MNEEEKAIKRLKEITNDYSINSEDLHYAIVLYHLIINLQQENRQLKDKIEIRNKEKTHICNQLHKYKHTVKKLKVEITKLLSINKLRKDRIDKAVELVNTRLRDVNLHFGIDNEFREEYDELLEILKGEK